MKKIQRLLQVLDLELIGIYLSIFVGAVAFWSVVGVSVALIVI